MSVVKATKYCIHIYYVYDANLLENTTRKNKKLTGTSFFVCFFVRSCRINAMQAPEQIFGGAKDYREAFPGEMYFEAFK